jgi:hypothetical protein
VILHAVVEVAQHALQPVALVRIDLGTKKTKFGILEIEN